nr:MAG TPA: hypothetical protein [Caudoviricetes sp.]
MRSRGPGGPAWLVVTAAPHQKPRPGRENRAGVFKGIWHGMAYRTTCTGYHGPAAVSTLFF